MNRLGCPAFLMDSLQLIFREHLRNFQVTLRCTSGTKVILKVLKEKDAEIREALKEKRRQIGQKQNGETEFDE